ncbi:MAG: tetratricopeptide repeat protein [Bacteroidales bacterium]|nr:tetratricopeptide repeat protein [Bacteroidales bacterium]
MKRLFASLLLGACAAAICPAATAQGSESTPDASQSAEPIAIGSTAATDSTENATNATAADTATAQWGSWAQADSAYAQSDYVLAARLYEEQLTKGVNATLYYNLGNTYYRLNNYPQAILNYERALKLAPDDEDAAYNLAVCRSKANIPESKPSEMFFITWADRLVRAHSADFWGTWAVVCFTFGIGCWAVYFLGRQIRVRKWGFALMCVMILAVVGCATAATLQQRHFLYEQRAVVMIETPLSTEDGKTAAAPLAPGTTVVILDEHTDGKYLIESLDRKTRGWVEKANLNLV